MEIYGDFQTSVRRALSEIKPDYDNLNGLVICGSHAPKEQDFLINRIMLARTNNIPALLICYGHQLGAIEYARNVLGIKDATSEEWGEGTFVVKKRKDGLNVGLKDGESYWNNYEVAIDWEIPEHFVSVPFHPEYQSCVGNEHPLLKKFLKLCGS